MSFFKNQLLAPALLIFLQGWTSGAALAGEPAATEHRPRVIEFYASWCQPCQSLKPAMDRAKADFGSAVEFVSYDVDDPAVREIVEQYDVCPIPTVIFLDENDNVRDYAVGVTRDANLRKGISKLLKKGDRA